MIRLFLFLEVLLFFAASALHFGLLAKGYKHPKARIAELCIGMILLAGLILTFIQPENQNQIARVAQGLALVGTIVGIITVIIGIGPRSGPDYLLHVLMLILLLGGLFWIG